jgi:DNA polymerase-4
VVGGIGARGVVSAASYEARMFGVHSAMPMARARRACPQAVFLPPRFGRYTELSRAVMAVLADVSPLVEQLSIDEAFVDVAGARRLLGDAPTIAALVRARVRSEVGLTVSVGVASTKFLAKLAGDLSKPDGLLVVESGTERAFLAPLPVGRLWGVGPATLRKLERMGVRTIGDVAALPESALTSALGASLGAHLSALARNDDPRAVVTDREAKSIGAEETFATDLRDRAACDRELVRLADRVTGRARQAELLARTITLKVRFADFETVTRARTLPDATALSTTVLRAGRELLAPMEIQRGVRLLGLSLSQLGEHGEVQTLLALDDAVAVEQERTDRREAVERAADGVRDRFGAAAIRPATLVEQPDADRRRPDGRHSDVPGSR